LQDLLPPLKGGKGNQIPVQYSITSHSPISMSKGKEKINKLQISRLFRRRVSSDSNKLIARNMDGFSDVSE
jgi:hypothetical protein